MMAGFWAAVGEAAADLFFPRSCASCQVPLEAGYLCAACARRARQITPPFCQRCSEPFDGAITAEFICPNCHDRELHYDFAVSSRRARGVVRHLIHQFKYGKREYLRQPLVGWLEENLTDDRITRQRVDGLIPVPLHPRRKRERGYNQAEILAELLAQRQHLRLMPVLQRVRYTQTQTAFDRAERMENLHNAFRLRQSGSVRNLHLLLVDDVLTTGSTLNECARVLREAGAASVRAICVARG